MCKIRYLMFDVLSNKTLKCLTSTLDVISRERKRENALFVYYKYLENVAYKNICSSTSVPIR